MAILLELSCLSIHQPFLHLDCTRFFIIIPVDRNCRGRFPYELILVKNIDECVESYSVVNRLSCECFSSLRGGSDGSDWDR